MFHLQFDYLEMKYAARLTLQDVIQYKFCWSNSPIRPVLELEWVVNYVFQCSPHPHALPQHSANTLAFRCHQGSGWPLTPVSCVSFSVQLSSEDVRFESDG